MLRVTYIPVNCNHSDSSELRGQRGPQATTTRTKSMVVCFYLLRRNDDCLDLDCVLTLSQSMADNLPTSERSLNGQAVLEEDEYTAALSHIIARDFFPSLVHLDAAHQYLDALKTEDSSLINQSVRRLEQLSSTPALPRNAAMPSQTPYGLGGETPLRTPRILGDEPPSKRARYDLDISLDTFQARYTSEDNSSFTKILDDENRKRRDRWAWAWEAQQRVEGQKAKAIEGRERMLIEGPSVTGVRERFMIDAPKPAGLITEGEKEEGESSGERNEDSEKEKGKGKELVLQSEDDQPVDVMAPKKDTRPAGVDGWRFKVRLHIYLIQNIGNTETLSGPEFTDVSSRR